MSGEVIAILGVSAEQFIAILGLSVGGAVGVLGPVIAARFARSARASVGQLAGDARPDLRARIGAG